MLYKLLVKQFDRNVNNDPLVNEKGEEIKENYKTVSTVIGKVAVSVSGEVVKDLTDKIVTTDQEIVTVEIKERTIIPSRIKTNEFVVYQKIENNQLAGYYDEEGNEFSFENNDAAFEASIIDEKPELPQWYK